MIRVDKNETFPILVSVINENTGQLVTGQTVYYDIREMDDSPLGPPISGILTESSVELGIYRHEESIPTAGEYVIYATCSGFITNTEEVIVNPESIYDLEKQNYHQNISVEDVKRTNAVPTASQTARNVPLGNTDYIVTLIKENTDSDWTSPIASGSVYAHYEDITDTVPYKMGGPF